MNSISESIPGLGKRRYPEYNLICEKGTHAQSAFLNLRLLIGLVVFFGGIFLVLFAAASQRALTREHPRHPGAEVGRPGSSRARALWRCSGGMGGPLQRTRQ